jgi:hypothetical protein
MVAKDEVPATEPPVYGALDRGRCAQGPAIRFGPAFLRLRREVTSRSIPCFPDSVFEPELAVGPDRLTEAQTLADAADPDDLDRLHRGTHPWRRQAGQRR